MQPGDVILLEQQWGRTSGSPPATCRWSGIRPAARHEPEPDRRLRRDPERGGHGRERGRGRRQRQLQHRPLVWYGDSGAIIVGAGGAVTSGDLTQRCRFSSYGSRFDLQGWGEDVVTTGYGDLHDGEGANRWYTATFNGTSSASAVVAGAVASLVGWYKANVSRRRRRRRSCGRPWSPRARPGHARRAGDIGPRPDLAAAIAALTPVVPPLWTDVTAGPLGDTGYGKRRRLGRPGQRRRSRPLHHQRPELVPSAAQRRRPGLRRHHESRGREPGLRRRGHVGRLRQRRHPRPLRGQLGRANRLFQNLGALFFDVPCRGDQRPRRTAWACSGSTPTATAAWTST